MQRFEVGLLDFGARAHGELPEAVIDRTLCLSLHAEALGFSHYWLAEHHSLECSWASPELMVALVAQNTRRIRVGPAGLLLVAHNPLRIACDFSFLSSRFPGRIDLGLARGIPGPNSATLVGPDLQVASPSVVAIFEERLGEILNYMPEEAPSGPPISNGPRSIPWPPRRPGIWVLGTGEVSMKLAARLRVNFGYSALHIGTKVNPAVFDQFRQQIGADKQPEAPLCNLAVAGVCSESEVKAAKMAKERAVEGAYPLVVGTPSQCHDIMNELCETFGVTSFTFLDLAYSYQDRLESLTLLAGALNLAP
jgi:luciferase family oxidoreductase group 1